MDTEPNWRTVANGILYSVQFRRHLDESVVDRTAQAVLAEPLFDLAPAENYEAIVAALATEAKLTELMPAPHGEQEFRGFLHRLVKRLDDLRPWPEPAFQRLDIRLDEALWEDFRQAAPIARLGLGTLTVERRLHRMFQPVPDADEGTLVLALRLLSGTEVALVASADPDSVEMTLRPRRGAGSECQQVLADFRAAAGFTEDELTPE